jgi:hypothetical protein
MNSAVATISGSRRSRFMRCEQGGRQDITATTIRSAVRAARTARTIQQRARIAGNGG